MYKFHIDNSLSGAIEFMTAGNISYISDNHKKIREVSDRLVIEGYNPYELLLFFANEWVGKGGFEELRIINRWTSDTVWVEFVKYKQRIGLTSKHLYTIECNDMNLRLKNDLSTKQDIITTNVCAFNAVGPVVKLDLAMQWTASNPDPVLEAWINQNWQLAMIFIMGLPEFLPYVDTFRNHLIQEGSIYETAVPCHTLEREIL